MHDKKAGLVVPAYNEAKTIGNVLTVARESGVFEKIVCIDDGSSDGTSQIAATVRDITVISQKNSGKALAMMRGLTEIESPVICFLDGDLLNLTAEHIRSLVEPVASGAVLATIGIFKSGRGPTDFAQRVAPMISGQRCLRKDLLDDFRVWQTVRFGIEHALNDHLKSKGITMREIALPGVSHLMKEEKRGVIQGFIQRAKMYLEILRYNISKHTRTK